jgi:phosphoglycolate phosphatase-like HAD superfamily hydrolase
MVGDSHHDLDAAAGAGFRFFWASYGYCRDPGTAAPYDRLDRFADLLALIA